LGKLNDLSTKNVETAPFSAVWQTKKNQGDFRIRIRKNWLQEISDGLFSCGDLLLAFLLEFAICSSLSEIERESQ